MKFNFKIEKKLEGTLARAGILNTPHGAIETPAFVAVGTKATVKALAPEQIKDLGAQVVLANTYHLYLQPGDEIVKKAGGLGKFMNWQGPTMTDSGGFQVFSLGAAFGLKLSKIQKLELDRVQLQHGEMETEEPIVKLAKIDEGGVTFKSVIDGSSHRFTPERSMEIQANLGADIIFAFDECTAPDAPYEYQREAMERTHRWAIRSLTKHHELASQKNADKTQKNAERGLSPAPQDGGTVPAMHDQALFGIVQGGRHKDLREESAKILSEMRIAGPRPEDDKVGFSGFGIGGSFDKEDMYTVVEWVNKILPEEKPRHLLGIGEPEDLFGGIENGCDLFDCVAPTRIARNGTLYTKHGKINILNAKYRNDLSLIEDDCECYVCGQGDSLPEREGVSLTSTKYSRAYLAHLFRSKEILASTLASIHNLYFIVNLVKKIRQSILDGNFFEFKEKFLREFKK